MRIVEIREKAIPIEPNGLDPDAGPGRHTVSLVAAISDTVRGGRPVAGIAFNSVGRYAQSGPLRQRFIPRLMEADPDSVLDETGAAFDPGSAVRIMMRDELPGGHGDRAHAVAAVELALWDLNAKLAGIPAWQLIARSFDVATPERIPLHAAGGYYYPEDGLGRLKDEMKRYVDLGFTAFKMRIGGASLAEDMNRIDAALSVIRDPNKLAVDAGGRFDAPTAIAFGRGMIGFGLRWYEEPGDPLDYRLINDLSEFYEGPLATGGSLFSVRDVANLIWHGQLRPGQDFFQMDPTLSYGLGEFARMLQAVERAGHPRAQIFPHGGHMIALHIVIGLGLGGSEVYPGVLGPVAGFAPDCILKDGAIAAGPLPGFGLEAKPDLAPHIAELLN